VPEVPAHHAGTVAIEHTLGPFAVVMAGADVFDPFKD
jgi:tRNA-splicing ligase RtcB